MPSLLLALLVGLGWRVTSGLRTLRRTEGVAVDVGRTLGEIQQLHWLRSASVRVAVSSPGGDWEQRYHENHSALELAIARAQASPMASAAMAEVMDAGARLVRVEAAALAAHARGEVARATALLDDPDYAAQQGHFEQGVQRALDSFHAQSRAALLAVRRDLMVEAGLCAALLTLIVMVLQTMIERLRRSARELAVARDTALASQRARDELLSNVSHELRTPLNGIIGSVELLDQGGLDGEQRVLVETIRTSSLTMVDLIAGLLDFAAVEAGRIELVEDEVDLRRIFDGVQDLFAPQARAKGLELTALVAGDVPPLLSGDPVRLRQVLIQLVSNAVKFTDRGEVSLRAELERHDKDLVTLRLHVQDSGIGIEESALETLFEAFEQLDTTSTRVHGGTGLGLALARGLAELMGGTLTARSEVGVGSMFTFTCVLRTRPGTPARTPSFEGQRVLLVDDGSANMRTVWELLLTWGAPVEHCEDVPSALAALDSGAAAGRAFQFVVFDLDHAGSSLVELCDGVGDGSAIGFLEHGAIPPSVHERLIVLERPVHQSDLLDRLQECLSRVDRIVLHPAVAAAGGLHVLLVEDNEVNQRIAEALLSGLGCRVDVAANGASALEHMEQARYAMVFMDCQMPVLDGYETTREVRRREGSTRHTPIVALTANALAGDREKCLAAGMDDYLTKPIQREGLADAVRRWASAVTTT